MKTVLRLLTLVAIIFTLNANAQRVRLTGALGGSAYYGDLIQGTPLLKQISPALTIGGSYDISDKLRLRLNFSTLAIKADDKDNANINLKERNLNFKSSVWEISAAAEYDILDNANEYSFTPYIFAGPGLFHFNPYTTDRFGDKQYLKDWGTEGQGLAAFTDRKPYALTQMNIGFGAGIRFDISDAIQLGTELFIRKTFTDYLDDVSQDSYVDPAIFVSQGNSFSQYLSYRGDEQPIGKSFRGTTMPRGNPSNKDLFYTFQLKLTYKLLNVDWGGSTGFYGGGGGRRVGRMRNPRTVL